jgi:AcrR family transcriptional regulator
MKTDAEKTVARETKLSAKGQLRRANVLSVAKKMLLSEGVDNLILRKVATEADIKLGHLQHYFPTRDDLLEALICEAWESDEAELVKATTAEDIKGVIADLLEAWAGDRGKIYLVLTLRSLYDPRFKTLKEKIYQRFYLDLIVFLKEIHPTRSRTELLRQAKIITSLMDGAMLQDHCGSARTVKKQRKDFYQDLVELAFDIIQR